MATNPLDLPITPTVGGVVTAAAIVGTIAIITAWALFEFAPPVKIKLVKSDEDVPAVRYGRKLLKRK